MSIWALDPGKTCGWCYVDIDRDIVETGVVKLDDLPEVLLYGQYTACRRIAQASTVVCESFNLRPHQAKQQGGSPIWAPLGIGVLRGVCTARGYSWPTMRPPGCKSAGRAWAKAKLPEMLLVREHLTTDHERDALDLAAYELRCQYIATRKASA